MATEPDAVDEQGPPPTGAVEAATPARFPWRRLALFAAVVAALLALVYFSPLREYLQREKELREHIARLGWMAPVVVVASVALLVAIGFPRLVLCGVAGMLLGFWFGLLWAQLGTLIGNYAVFLVARRGGHDWAEHYLLKKGKLHALARQEGLLGVILARQLPMPGLLINLACGLMPLRQRDFLLGTIIGQLPEAIPCTLIGAGAIAASSGRNVGLIGVAVVLAVLVWIGFRFALKQRAARPNANGR